MCGIIGILGKIPEQKIIEQARDKLQHRGPDDSGIYYNPTEKISLGHRRLSIIDLSNDGHQPFFSHDKRYVMVFNGEIYNYLEIKEELKEIYNFQTKTDTEVLLAAYIQWGEKCLDKFNGIFSFAIWDIELKRLFCARDRLGVKPFFYYLDHERFAFASEIKALLGLGVFAKINESVIFDYLYYGIYDHSEQTFFKDIFSLEPGHYLIWQDNKISIKKYWDLADINNELQNWSEDEIKCQFKELLTDAIRLQFRSDVPVGINLSSGLDSNSLLYYSKQVTGQDVHTFSICSSSKEYDECELIAHVLNDQQKKTWHTANLEPHEVFLLANKINIIEDQPYGGIPTIAYDKLIAISKKDQVTVLLEGQGLDEILAGYKYYELENKKDLLADNSVKNSEFTSLSYSQDMTPLTDVNILDKNFVAKYKEKKLNFPEPFNSHLLNAQYRDLRYTKLPRVLRFNDHVSMFYSRELRVPFLDHRLVEFCFQLPAKFKINQGVHKFLMREMMQDYLPEIIKNKPKKAFGAIQTEWLRDYHKKEVMEIINSDSFKNRIYWNHDELIKKINNFYTGEGDNSFFIWQCINLELWFREFMDK